jgi:hypothetical protein
MIQSTEIVFPPVGAKSLEKPHKTPGRPRSESPMIRTQVVLPLELRDTLQRAADAHEHGLSAETRQRLQASCELEGLNSHTRQLIEDTRKLAESLALDIGVQWHESEFVRKAFKAGFGVFLQEYDPNAERVPDTPFSGYPDDAPHDVVGQTHARLILRSRRGQVAK